MIRRLALAFLSTALAFGALDFVWLTTTNARLYRPALGDLLTPGFRPLPAALFYLIYLLGVVVFAVAPAVRVGRWSAATARGAFFGLVAYATYDLTNQATLVHWPVSITVIDLCWGALATSLAASAGYLASRLSNSN